MLSRCYCQFLGGGPSGSYLSRYRPPPILSLPVITDLGRNTREKSHFPLASNRTPRAAQLHPSTRRGKANHPGLTTLFGPDVPRSQFGTSALLQHRGWFLPTPTGPRARLTRPRPSVRFATAGADGRQGRQFCYLSLPLLSCPCGHTVSPRLCSASSAGRVAQTL